MSDLTSERINGIIRKIFVVLLIVFCALWLFSCVSSCGSGSGSRKSSSYHECHVCGERATEKIDSYWYCSYHAAMVRAVTGD